MQAGAEVVGGLDSAGYDGDPVEHLDAVFGIAARRGCKVDIHLHDQGDLGVWEVRLIVERTRALGLAGRVTISRALCIATLAPPAFDVLARDLAEQRIALATVAPGAREPLPLRRLRDAGVVVALGQDGIRDLWSPYGSGDMLERTMLLAWRTGFRRDEDLGMALDAARWGSARPGPAPLRPRCGLPGLCGAGPGPDRRGGGRCASASLACRQAWRGRPGRAAIGRPLAHVMP